MSLRNEQYASLKRTRAFLFAIVSRDLKRIPSSVREEASSCLRHYPFLDEHGKPMFSQDPFGPDDPSHTNPNTPV